MPRSCVIGGCSNSQCDGVTLHFWPKNEKIARKWDLFAQIKRADWIRGIPGVSTICGIHFTPSDYDGYGQWKAGLIKQLRLNSDAVPTVNVAVSGAPSATVTQPEPSQSRACAMIEINRSLAADTNKEDDSSSSVSDSDDSSSTSVSDVDVENSVCDKAKDKCGVSAGLVRNDGGFPRKNRKILRTAAEEAKAHAVFLSQLKFSRDIACQTDSRQKISVATQYTIIPQLNRSYGTQVSWTRRLTKSQGTQISVLSVSVGIGTPFQWKRPPPVQSSTFRKPFLPSKRRRLKLDDGESVLTEATLSQASHSINHVPTYVVDEDCLLQLFEECPVCGSMCEVQKTTIETFLTIHQLCPQCHFNRNWRSQQMEKAVPSGDVHNCTSDPESSAITATVGFSDDNDSSDEGQSSEVDGGDCNSDSDWDPVEHHNGDIESDADGRHDVAFRQLCPECGRYFYSQTHTCENKKPYSCNVCGKRYVCEVTLKAHSKVHEDGYKHVCKYCLSTFRMRADKLAHEKRHPPRKQPYQCPDCPRVFAKIEERRKHLLSHRGPKKHICHTCSMEFFCPGSLERHMVVHTKAKQFVCEVCQRSFTQTNHLKSHMRVHTGEKPYQCQHCNKSFNHNVSLKSHIQRYHGQVPDPGENVQMEKTSRNESEVEKDETNEMESSAVDAEEVERSKDTLCNAGNGGDEEKVKKIRRSTGRPRGRPKKKVKKIRRSTGRPRGRPKKKASWNESEVEKDETNEMESSAVDAEKAKMDEMESSDVDADKAKMDEMESSGVDTDEATEQSNTLCNPDDEQLQRVPKKERYKYKSTGRPRGRPKKNTLLTLDDVNQLKRPLGVGDENDKRQGNSTDEEREHA